MIGFSAVLSDGSTLNEWELSSPEKPGWFVLKDILKEKSLKIIELKLIYENQVVYVRPRAKIYFYAKRVEAWLGAKAPEKHYYGIGAEIGHGKVEITWYDGRDSVIETRDFKETDQGMIRND